MDEPPCDQHVEVTRDGAGNGEDEEADIPPLIDRETTIEL